MKCFTFSFVERQIDPDCLEFNTKTHCAVDAVVSMNEYKKSEYSEKRRRRLQSRTIASNVVTEHYVAKYHRVTIRAIHSGMYWIRAYSILTFRFGQVFILLFTANHSQKQFHVLFYSTVCTCIRGGKKKRKNAFDGVKEDGFGGFYLGGETA